MRFLNQIFEMHEMHFEIRFWEWDFLKNHSKMYIIPSKMKYYTLFLFVLKMTFRLYV